MVVFIHVYTVNNYQEILNSLFNANRNLFSQASVKIYHTEGNITFPCFMNPEVFQIPNWYEFPTLNEIYKHSKEVGNNEPVLYLHTKGVTTPENLCIKEWREYMTYFLVEKYQECLDLLKYFDTCGVDLIDEPMKHYSGNFWWSNSNYLKRLPLPEDTISPLSYRHKCEFWICSGEGNHHSIHNSNINPYQRHLNRYPRSSYES